MAFGSQRVNTLYPSPSSPPFFHSVYTTHSYLYVVFTTPFPSPHPSHPHTLTGAEPTESEREMFGKVAVVLCKAPDMLADLRSYKGAGELIREVGQSHSDAIVVILVQCYWVQSHSNITVVFFCLVGVAIAHFGQRFSPTKRPPKITKKVCKPYTTNEIQI